MGSLDDAIKNHDIFSQDGFDGALRDLENVSEGEIRFYLLHEPGAHTPETKKKILLSKAVLERRVSREEAKKSKMNAFFGIGGVILGSVLTKVLDLLF